jgi:hypothetical protein
MEMEGGRRLGCRMGGCSTLEISPFPNGATGYASCQVTGLIQVRCRIPNGIPVPARWQSAVLLESGSVLLLTGSRGWRYDGDSIAGAGSVGGFAMAVPMLMRAVLSCSVSW